MKISIIVPVFNVADYLEACITSCLKQTLQADQYEILLIDDGSDDSSWEICRRYAAENKHITAYSQSNAGQGAARNNGLKRARGEYIWFVDADDKIHENMLEQLYASASSNNLDMLAFRGVEVICGAEKRDMRHNQLAKGILTGKDYLFYDYSVCSPLYLFRNSFLVANKMKFPEGVFHEDEDFILRSLYHCKTIGFLDQVAYDVTVRQGSTTRSINPKKAYDLLVVSDNLSRFANNQVEPAYRRAFHNRISLLLNSMLLNVSLMNKPERSEFMPVLQSNRYLFRHMRKSNRIKYRLEGWLFFLMPRLFPTLHKIVKKYF